MINENITRQPQTWWCVINGGNVNLWQVMNEFICERDRVVISLGRITKCACGHLMYVAQWPVLENSFQKLRQRIMTFYKKYFDLKSILKCTYLAHVTKKIDQK